MQHTDIAFFQGTEEEQIERQRQMMKQRKYDDGTRVFVDGTAFHAYVQNKDTLIITTRIALI